MEKLKGKAELVNWHRDDREDYYGLIAKSVEGKGNLRGRGCFVFDLGDFSEIMK